MKKNILIAFVVFLSACTFTKQQKAESIVKKYLDTTLNDPHSYESVSFDKLVTVHKIDTTLDDDTVMMYKREYYALEKKANYIAKKYKRKDGYDPDFSINHPEYDSITTKSSPILEKFSNRERDISEKKQTTPISYHISHTYRAKNGFGALLLYTTTFEIDSLLSKVTYTSEKTN